MKAQGCTEQLKRGDFVQTLGRVSGQEAVSARYFWLRLNCPAIARCAQPGQFVMLSCATADDESTERLLQRPFALLDAHGDEIELLYYVAGGGTAQLRAAAEERGAVFSILGPLGRGFQSLANVDAHVALGGGSGIAPLVFFFRRQAVSGAAQNGRASWHLILGARTAGDLTRPDVVETPGRLHCATDDGSAGIHGTAVDALKALLGGELKGARVGLYLAGPEPMLEAAAKIGRAKGFPVAVSLEARMACGVGVCRACVVTGTKPHPKTGLLRRCVCQDGPVFDIDELSGW